MLRLTVLVIVLAGSGFSAKGLFSPDTYYDWGLETPPSRVELIAEFYVDGRGSYWENHAEFAWVWFQESMGWESAWNPYYRIHGKFFMNDLKELEDDSGEMLIRIP